MFCFFFFKRKCKVRLLFAPRLKFSKFVEGSNPAVSAKHAPPAIEANLIVVAGSASPRVSFQRAERGLLRRRIAPRAVQAHHERVCGDGRQIRKGAQLHDLYDHARDEKQKDNESEHKERRCKFHFRVLQRGVFFFPPFV